MKALQLPAALLATIIALSPIAALADAADDAEFCDRQAAMVIVSTLERVYLEHDAPYNVTDLWLLNSLRCKHLADWSHCMAASRDKEDIQSCSGEAPEFSIPS